MAKNVGSQAKEGVFWTFLFDAIEVVFSFIVGIVLARVLGPAVYGIMGMVSIATQFARRLGNFGFSTVLVQLKEVRNEHYDTVYYINILLMSIVGAVIIFSAPAVARFFDTDVLNSILPIVALDFLLKAFASVPQAILKREMRFKELGMAQSVGKFTGISCQLVLALTGYGIWSLVIGAVVGSFAYRSAVIFFSRKVADWRPGLRFSKVALKECFSFGAWIYVSSFISFGINKVDYILIGRFLGDAMLGAYEKAFELMSLPRKKLVRKVNSVLFSSYSRIQDDNQRVASAFLQVVSYLAFITYPLMTWLFFVAPSLISIVYGSDWLAVIVPLQIMCIAGVIDSYTLIFQPLMKAKGLVGNHARRDFFYLAVLIIAVWLGIQSGKGIIGVASGVAMVSFIRLGMMMQLATRHLPITVLQFIRAQRSAAVYVCIQIAILLAVQYFARPYFHVDSWEMLASVTILSPILFFGAHKIIRFQDVETIWKDIAKDTGKLMRKVPLLKKLAAR